MLGYSFTTIILFSAFVIIALLIDLHAHKHDEAISMKNAALWSVFWVLSAFAFSAYIGIEYGADHSSLFLSGYLLEKSLSVDNLFIFMAIFSSFNVKDEYQHRVLYYGIIGALVLRFIFIAAGSEFLHLFGPYALGAFGLFVLWSAYKMWVASNDDKEDDEDFNQHWAAKLASKVFPVWTDNNGMDGHKFFTINYCKDSIYATKLFLCLVVIEVADVMFAFDSVPAVIAITQDPFLVYTSNIFAILGLRSMYFLLAAAKTSLIYLEKSVIVILAFIGFKMLAEVFGVVHISPTISLCIVAGCLLVGVGCSIPTMLRKEQLSPVKE